MKINSKKFTDAQLVVINDLSKTDSVFEELLNISSNSDFSLSQKRSLMFKHLILFIQQRRQDFLNVGIKSNVANALVSSEIKILKLVTKELKDVISQG